MPQLPSDFYLRWRPAPTAPTAAVADGPDRLPERWLQQIWRHQRLRRDELRGLDGRPIRVLHPGFWNRGPGPDFQRAVIQFGGDTPLSGEVEVDLGVGGWRGHGHDRDARYAGVILHVVWEAPVRDFRPPVLALAPFLEAPLAELAPWLAEEAETTLPATTPGQCCAPLAAVDAATLAELLHQAAQVRLRRKAGEFALRARHAGWERALWEGLFTALGYRHNTWPMRRLAELTTAAPPEVAPEPCGDPLRWEARLLGLAGLLPGQLPPGDNAGHARTLWDIWWREQDAWAEHVLPRTVWEFAGLRPANHPHRRLALAARWLAAADLPRRLERWLAEGADNDSFAERLLAALAPAPEPDSFWARHWTLRSPTLRQNQTLLGAPRVTDLALNVVLPWLHARAAAGGNETVLREVERRHFAWPAGEDNAVLKLARARLFGGSARRFPRTAAAQQGLLQIARDFCDRADARCAGCRFPELVRALPTP